MVTAAASGVGRACAARLAAAGAAVALVDADGAAARSAARDIAGDVIAVQLDVSEETAWPAAMAAVASRWQRLDIMVNSAAVAKSAAHDLEDFPSADWRRVMAINLEGTLLGCRHAVLAMKHQGCGSIVNVAAVLGEVGGGAFPAWSASTGGIVQLTRSVALHCGSRGYAIRCNAVTASGLAGPMTVGALADTVLHDEPLARAPDEPGSTRDVAELVVYLAGDDSSFATGAVFSVGHEYPAR